MKIFNIENGNEKVYVQLCDIAKLEYIDDPIPATIYRTLKTKPITEDNRLTFIEFSKQDELDFFKEQSWIIDYKKLSTIKEENIHELQTAIAKEIDELRNKYQSMSQEEKNNNENLLNRILILRHQNQNINEILHTKAGFYIIDYPLVQDFDGFIVSNETYIVSESLTPNTLLFYRKDEKPLQKNEYDEELISAGIDLAVSTRSEDEKKYTGKLRAQHSYTEDNKYLVLSYKLMPKNDKDRGIHKVLSVLADKKKR